MKHLSEQEVLNIVGIDNFRNMSKEKTIEVVSMLNQVDTEVAKSIVEQFPHFADTAKEIVSDAVSKLGDKAIDSSDNENERFNQICNRVLDTLDDMSKQSDLTFDEKCYIIDQMQWVITKCEEHTKESNKHHEGILKIAGGVAIAVTAILSTALGGKIRIPKK